MRNRFLVLLLVAALASGFLFIFFGFATSQVAFSAIEQLLTTDQSVLQGEQAGALAAEDSDAELSGEPRISHRLIVELESPPLAAWVETTPSGKLSIQSTTAQDYLAQLADEQAAFQNVLQAAYPEIQPSTYVNELGAEETAQYRIAFNGMAIDPGAMDTTEARRALEKLPGVKHVYLDYAYSTNLYTSTYLIDAPTLWNQLGGQADAGRGVKLASMDGGAHHEAPMFSGEGFSYPTGYPFGGLGNTANNNGKIIASRVYFRSWDPPAAGEENPWPGTSGTSHGVHTASTAGGNLVTGADYLGTELPPMSGVAPGAWIMSYRVFYNSVTNDGSFYTTEGLAALEDIVADGADVLNNSWGGGPGSIGGEFDALDTALINAANAGVFVSMSNGNAGPGLGTGDHPSDDYINVAASTTSGTYASGRFSVIEPPPVLPNMAFSSASFGGALTPGNVYSYTYLAAANVDGGVNTLGCNPFPPGTFTGKAAVISRGSCEFGVKVLNAENAGAEFVVVYNTAAGGDSLINMGPGAVGGQVTISSIFIGYDDGLAVVAKQTAAAGAGEDAVLEMNMIAFQLGNTPDVIASFSSRGPSVAMTLKPDIAAPGVNIMAQGYTPNTIGEDRHLGFGQASGTSMAAPHVSGAAALLRSIHPDWSNAYIKSALMSTSKYMDIYNSDGSPAQPLDMGAGRLDLTNAAAPGVILDPPSLSFGLVPTGTTKSLNVTLISVAEGSQTYTLTTLYTGDGFDEADLRPVDGVTVEPTSVTLMPGQSTVITVTFDSTAGMGIGDNQGFIVMGGSVHEAHMPLWARVLPESGAEVLLIGSDFSYLFGYNDYSSYYMDALDDLGITYDFWNADQYYGNPQTIPSAAEMMAYEAVILFTGDHYQANGTYTVVTPFSLLDMNALTEYANAGGTIIAMGQDLAGTMSSAATDDGEFFYSSVLGGNWLQDSVTNEGGADRNIVALPNAPAALQGVQVDVAQTELLDVILAGFNEIPPVATTTGGVFSYGYDASNNVMYYNVEITAGDPVTLTAAHVHSGTISTNGPIVAPIFPFGSPQYVTETISWNGSFTMTAAMLNLYQAGNLYVNVHSTQHPSGEIRAQLIPHFVGDGAGNLIYIDEIAPKPFSPDPSHPEEVAAYTALLTYPGPYNVENGVVAMAHRDQPSLERPGISYLGRSIYTTFGLEGVNNDMSGINREDLLGAFLTWAMDEPVAEITDVTIDNASGLTRFEAEYSSNIPGASGTQYRWDFGDGSDYTNFFPNADASHVYAECGVYTVRVEVVDSWGNHAIGTEEIDVTHCVEEPVWKLFMPVVFNNYNPADWLDLTILHTNDTHARVDQYNRNGATCTPADDVADLCIAGTPRLATVVENIRSNRQNVLLVDAGDQFQGTLFYNVFKGDVLTLTMNYLGYDAMAVGNHEFDDGPDTLASFINGADFPVLSANIDASADADLNGLILPYTVVERDGHDIGIIGLTTPDTSNISSPGPNISFTAPVTTLQNTVDVLEGMGIDKIIALTHMGYDVDLELAEQVSGVDVIVGGHSHSFLYYPAAPISFTPPTFPQFGPLVPAGEYPTVVDSPADEPVLVVTAYQWGAFLGNLDVTFGPDGLVHYYQGNPIFLSATVAKDPVLDAMLQPFRDGVAELNATVVGTTTVDLPINVGGQQICRLEECLLGNLVADAMLWKANEVEPGANYQIAFQNGGGLRAPIISGTVTMGAVMETLPFGNAIATFELEGQYVKAALENGASRYPSANGGFAQVSGLKYVINPAQPVGSRISGVEVWNGAGWDPLNLSAMYRVVTNDFMRRGGDNYTMFRDYAVNPYDFGPALDQALADHIKSFPNATVTPEIEGRITFAP